MAMIDVAEQRHEHSQHRDDVKQAHAGTVSVLVVSSMDTVPSNGMNRHARFALATAAMGTDPIRDSQYAACKPRACLSNLLRHGRASRGRSLPRPIAWRISSCLTGTSRSVSARPAPRVHRTAR